MTKLKNLKPSVWQSREFTCKLNAGTKTETDVIHHFIKALDLKKFRIEKIQIFDVPARAIISLKIKSNIQGDKKSTLCDAKIDLEVRQGRANESFTLQYTVLSYPRANETPNFLASLRSSRAAHKRAA